MPKSKKNGYKDGYGNGPSRELNLIPPGFESVEAYQEYRQSIASRAHRLWRQSGLHTPDFCRLLDIDHAAFDRLRYRPQNMMPPIVLNYIEKRLNELERGET